MWFWNGHRGPPRVCTDGRFPPTWWGGSVRPPRGLRERDGGRQRAVAPDEDEAPRARRLARDGPVGGAQQGRRLRDRGDERETAGAHGPEDPTAAMGWARG
jgi:hypothetical protein